MLGRAPEFPEIVTTTVLTFHVFPRNNQRNYANQLFAYEFSKRRLLKLRWAEVLTTTTTTMDPALLYI